MEDIKKKFDELIELYDKELCERKRDLNECFVEMQSQCEKLKAMRERYLKAVKLEKTATHVV